MTTTSRGQRGRGVAWVVIAGLAWPAMQACSPLEYCNPADCSLTPDAGSVDADVDAALDGDIDAQIDAGTDAGPMVPSPLDGMTLPSQVCSLGGWCWLSPHGPPKAQWDDVASVGATTEAWIVTDGDNGGATQGGAILHYDGTAWRGILGIGARRVATTPSGDAWFLSGERHVFMWSHTTSTFAARDGMDPTMATEVFNDIGASDTDVWIVGDAGAMRRWDGTMWNRHEPDFGPLPGNVNAVYVAGPDDLWIAGDGALVRHAKRSGTDWASPTVTTRDLGESTFDVAALWATEDATTLWAGGPASATEGGARYWNAGSWHTPTQALADVVAIDGTSAAVVYLLSASGTSDQRGFNGTLAPIDHAPGCTGGVVRFGANAYLRVGGSSTGPTTGPGCVSLVADIRDPSPQAASAPLEGPFGRVGSVEPLLMGAHVGELLVYAADGARTGHPETMTFTVVDPRLLPDPALLPDPTLPHDRVVIGASHGASDLWFDPHDGAGTLLHYDGTAWSAVVVAPGLSGVGDVVFAVDREFTWVAIGGQVYRWDPTSVPPAFVAQGGAFAEDVTQLAVSTGAAWAIHAGGDRLARLDAVWGDLTLAASWDPDCTAFVAQGPGTVECLAGAGRYRFMLPSSSDFVPITTMMGPASFSTGGVVRALAGYHGWILSADSNMPANEQLLWPQLEDQWVGRSSHTLGGGVVRMLSDGTSWRVVDGNLLEWRPRS